MMQGRVCIPIHRGNEVVGYAGRWADDDVPKDKPKYLLPPDFQKQEELYNLNRIEGTSHVVVVEGYFGCIRLHGLGVPTVALMGLSMSEQQVVLLVDAGITCVVLLLDNDEAGRQAQEKMLPLLTASFFTRVGLLPENEAPDTASVEVLREVAEIRLVSTALSFVG